MEAISLWDLLHCSTNEQIDRHINKRKREKKKEKEKGCPMFSLSMTIYYLRLSKMSLDVFSLLNRLISRRFEKQRDLS